MNEKTLAKSIENGVKAITYGLLFAGPVVTLVQAPTFGPVALFGLAICYQLLSLLVGRRKLVPGRAYPAAHEWEGRFQKVLRTHGYTKGRLLVTNEYSAAGYIQAQWRGNDLVVTDEILKLPTEQQTAAFTSMAVSRQHHNGIKIQFLHMAPAVLNLLVRVGAVMLLGGTVSIVQAILITVVTTVTTRGTKALRTEIVYHWYQVVDRTVGERLGQPYVDYLVNYRDGVIGADYQKLFAPLFARRIEIASQGARRKEYAS